MTFQDKHIRCSECGATFNVSAEKQEVSQSWGIHSELKRCPSCCQANKIVRYGTGSYDRSTSRQMFQATCADCGKDTRVPFEPRAGRRVYCSNCYRKVGVYR